LSVLQTEVDIPEAFQGLFKPHRHKAFYGGRGSAKSWSVATALCILARQRPLRIVAAREIQKNVGESAKTLIEDRARALGMDYALTSVDNETRLGESVFTYRGLWRNPEGIKSLEGADIFWGEEASSFSARSLQVIAPTMRKPGSEMWWTWNPEYDHDPVDDFFRGNAAKTAGKTWVPPTDALIREVSWKDNPWFGDTPLLADLERDYQVDGSMAAHVWGGAYIPSAEGAYYAEALQRAHEEGRITTIVADPVLRLKACWDLGYNDNTSIWIWQAKGRDINIIDHITGQGQHLSYYIERLREKGYDKAIHYLPHDGRNVYITAPGAAGELLKAAGMTVEIVPNQGKGAALLRVEATRRIFPQIWFDETRTRAGRKSLGAYHEKRDPERRIGLGPEHDWSSDDADAFGMISQVYKPPEPIVKKDAYRQNRRPGTPSYMGV
jgi:phage terminase large subunit